jgi:mono/diheme cytochrome c family protein
MRSKCIKSTRLIAASVIGLGMLSFMQVPAFAQSAGSLYAKKCAGCHGLSGNGDGPEGGMLVPPPEPFHTALKGQSDQWIATVIKGGGASVGLPPAMPAQPNLTDAQVEELVKYIKGIG